MRALLVVLGVAGQLSATPSPQSVNPSGPPSEHQPSTKVVENDRYYTLSVYQNNAGNSFEDNLINMDSAELKKGELSRPEIGLSQPGFRVLQAAFSMVSMPSMPHLPTFLGLFAFAPNSGHHPLTPVNTSARAASAVYSHAVENQKYAV